MFALSSLFVPGIMYIQCSEAFLRQKQNNIMSSFCCSTVLLLYQENVKQVK